MDVVKLLIVCATVIIVAGIKGASAQIAVEKLVEGIK